MKIQVHFNNVALSEALNSYLIDEVGDCFEKFGFNHSSADIHLNIVRARTEFRAPVFSCDINFKHEKSKQVKKIKMDGRDLYKAIDDMMEVLYHSLSEEVRRYNDHRRADKRKAKREIAEHLEF